MPDNSILIVSFKSKTEAISVANELSFKHDKQHKAISLHKNNWFILNVVDGIVIDAENNSMIFRGFKNENWF